MSDINDIKANFERAMRNVVIGLREESDVDFKHNTKLPVYDAIRLINVAEGGGTYPIENHNKYMNSRQKSYGFLRLIGEFAFHADFNISQRGGEILTDFETPFFPVMIFLSWKCCANCQCISNGVLPKKFTKYSYTGIAQYGKICYNLTDIYLQFEVDSMPNLVALTTAGQRITPVFSALQMIRSTTIQAYLIHAYTADGCAFCALICKSKGDIHMKKRIISLFLALVMVAGVLPGFTLCVSAEDAPEAAWGTAADNLTHTGALAEAIAALNAEDSTVSYIRLLSDVVLPYETDF